MFAKIEDWLRYPTSQAAIVAAVALVGIHISPENLESIVKGAVALVTLILGARSDSDVKPVK